MTTPDEMTMAQMLQRYPQGFVVSLSGHIFEVVKASSHLPVIATAYGLPPDGGGYFVTKPTNDRITK